jgi:hypothetical protein
MFEELSPFEWMGDRVEDSHSDVYNYLLETGHSNMTEAQCIEYAKMTGGFDIEEQIDEIKKLRKAFEDELDGIAMSEDEISQFVKDAYPFEILFVMRY